MNDAAEPTSKVVRLPRDWLGPHEELVPIGRRTMPAAVEGGEPERAGSPPNAEDFWGERSAAIHGVVQAGDTEASALMDEPPAQRPRFRLGRGHLAAASVLAVAVAIAVVLSGGAVHQIAGAGRLNLTAVFSGGVSRSFSIGPPRIVSGIEPSRPHTARVRHQTHRTKITAPVPRAIQHQSSAPPAPTYAARTTSTSVEPTYHSSVSRSRSQAGTGPSPSSGSSVTPTGESGAVGPVQSPNG